MAGAAAAGAGDARQLASSAGVLPLRRTAAADRGGMGICRERRCRAGRAFRQAVAMDRFAFSAVSGLRTRSVCGIFGAVVRHAQGASRGQLCHTAFDRARQVPQFLYAGARRHLRRLSHLRAVTVRGSRETPRVRRWAKLVRDARFRKSERRIVVEGPHLVGAAIARGLKPFAVLVSEEGSKHPEIRRLVAEAGAAAVQVSDAVLKAIVESEAPQGIAAELELPESPASRPGSAVFLEGIQDAGNVGAIARSAAAFGIGDLVLDAGCADAWSAKTLRAGAGAHFMLRIRQVASLGDALEAFGGKLVCTLPRGGVALQDAELSGELGWIFGSEGQGVSGSLQRRAALKLHIPTAPGTESLNVAAAAAVCLYAAASRPGAGS